MNLRLRHCQLLLVGAYISFNAIAYAGSVDSGVLSGDFAGFHAPAKDTGLVLLLVDALSYGLLLFPVFDGLRHFGRFRQARRGAIKLPQRIHVLVLLLQVFQLLFTLGTGVGTAGVFVQSDNPLRFIIYIIPIDLVAFIYLATADNNKTYKINFVTYLASSLTRGSSFGIVLLLAIATIRSNGMRLTLSRLLAWTVFLAITIPIILALRFFVREGADELSGITNLLDLARGDQNIYLYILGFLGDRLQHFTSMAYIFENRDAIATALTAGEIRPFFLDGTYFAPVAALFGHQLPLELNSWLTASYYGLDFKAVAYNTQFSLINWPMIAPGLLPVYLCFLGALGLCSMLMSRAIGSTFVVELTWLMWLFFLMNGWFGVFISYLAALLFFRSLQWATARRRYRRPATLRLSVMQGVGGSARRAGPARLPG